MGALSTRLLRDKPDHPPNPTNIRDYPLSFLIRRRRPHTKRNWLGETEAIVAGETAKLISEAGSRLDPAERRLLAGMPLHAITPVHGEADLRNGCS